MPIETPSGSRCCSRRTCRFSDVAASRAASSGARSCPRSSARCSCSRCCSCRSRTRSRAGFERAHLEREAALLPRARRVRAGAPPDRGRSPRRHGAGARRGVVRALGRPRAACARRRGGRRAGRARRRRRRGAVQELRSLLIEIYPPRLRESGLHDVLEDLVRPLEQRGCRPRAWTSPPGLELPYETTALLYRTAREAVRNVAEHAAATDVAHRAQRATTAASRSSVADDGKGFRPEDALDRPAGGPLRAAPAAPTRCATLAARSTSTRRPAAARALRVEVPA